MIMYYGLFSKRGFATKGYEDYNADYLRKAANALRKLQIFSNFENWYSTNMSIFKKKTVILLEAKITVL